MKKLFYFFNFIKYIVKILIMFVFSENHKTIKTFFGRVKKRRIHDQLIIGTYPKIHA